MVLPTSSATSSAPGRSIATPTGRPSASPASLTKPVRTSVGCPEGRPSANGTKITLCPARGLRFQDPCCPMNAPFLRVSGSKVPAENVKSE